MLDEVTSTMDVARRVWASEQPRHRVWVLGKVQKAGRGRLGRQWQSPPGNLHLSVLLPAPCLLRHQAKLGFVAGVALADAVSALVPGVSVQLKWPNDLLVEREKCAGLLLEGLDQGRAVILGLGVNIAHHPDDLPYPATHLAAYQPRLSVAEVLAAVSERLVQTLATFADGSGFPMVRERWLAKAAHRDRQITVKQGETEMVGRFREIDGDGQLILETTAGRQVVAAGDVFPLDNPGHSTHDEHG